MSNFCVTDKGASQAQSAAVAAAFAPSSVAVGATTTTTVPSTSLGASSKNIMKRKLPEPVDGWKDPAGKTHRVHHDFMQYHKTMSGIFRQIMDIFHEQSSNGSGEPKPDVMLARLVPLKDMETKWETYTVEELLEMGLSCVHEATHSLYVKHVYNGAVAETFLGDALFGADRTIPVEERVDTAVKHVHKLPTAAKAAVGQSSRGGRTSGKRGGGRRGGFNNYNGGIQQPYNI